MVIDGSGSLTVSQTKGRQSPFEPMLRIDPNPNLFHKDWDITFFQLKPDGLLVLEQQVKDLRFDVNPRLCQLVDEEKDRHSCRIQVWTSGVRGSPSKRYRLAITDSGDLIVQDLDNGELLWSSQETAAEVAVSSNVTQVDDVSGAKEISCIESGDEKAINIALDRPVPRPALCPGSIFRLKAPIVFSHDHQKLYTKGADFNNKKALIIVDDPSIVTAVSMLHRSFVELKDVVIDGNRENLGHVSPQFSSSALIDAGEGSFNQVISGVKAYDPRTWACLHVIEGTQDDPCYGAIVENNEIGPCGSHSNVHNEIADGISYACKSGAVRNNVVKDATDGGIVIFGAPGTIVEGNSIQAKTRTMLGGINMVDSEPYSGDYTGTIVRNNTIEARGARIHVGVGMGSLIWQCPMPNEQQRDPLHGGVVVNNTLSGSNMGYGYAVSGVKDWTVLANNDESIHGGEPALDCNGQMSSIPGGFQLDPSSSHGTFQSNFADSSLNNIVAAWGIHESSLKLPTKDKAPLGRRSPLVRGANTFLMERQLELA
ncbi:MAG: right-handed parallel beta-helix repeat-containing protein [Nanoarchaeota archaeon]|nr:right-handed parallel beta-helix repeat-containing protein [Nanoarchaeota archaeon]